VKLKTSGRFRWEVRGGGNSTLFPFTVNVIPTRGSLENLLKEKGYVLSQGLNSLLRGLGGKIIISFISTLTVCAFILRGLLFLDKFSERLRFPPWILGINYYF